MKLRLDTDGLRALIKDNPELEVEIGREVLNNIKADQIQAKVQGQIEACLKGMVKNEGTWHTPRYVPVDKQFTALIQKVVIEAVTHFTNEGLKAHVENLAVQAVQDNANYAARELKEILRTLITPEMAKEIVREKVLL
jgi:hypothetical protein